MKVDNFKDLIVAIENTILCGTFRIPCSEINGDGSASVLEKMIDCDALTVTFDIGKIIFYVGAICVTCLRKEDDTFSIIGSINPIDENEYIDYEQMGRLITLLEENVDLIEGLC